MNLNEKLICTHISLVERKIIIMVIMIIVNMKMSTKTSITTIIVIINKVTCIIIIVMDSAHTSLNSAGISLSCGKGRMDIRVVLQTKKPTAVSSKMTFLFTRFISLHFLPVKSSRKLSILVIIINGYSFGQRLVIYKVP